MFDSRDLFALAGVSWALGCFALSLAVDVLIGPGYGLAVFGAGALIFSLVAFAGALRNERTP